MLRNVNRLLENLRTPQSILQNNVKNKINKSIRRRTHKIGRQMVKQIEKFVSYKVK